MDEYLAQVQKKFGYSDELIDILRGVINSFLNVLGEEYKEKILYVVANTYIVEFEDIKQASEIFTSYFNDGTYHGVGSPATGSGVADSAIIIDENAQVHQKLIIGLDKNGTHKIHTLVHELIHAIGYVGNYKIEGDKLYIKTGFDEEVKTIENNQVKGTISEEGVVLNEVFTENMAMQVMDDYEPDIVHEPKGYNGQSTWFKPFFRNDAINSVAINDYFNGTYNYVEIAYGLLKKEDIDSIIDSLMTQPRFQNEIAQNMFRKLKELSVEEFLKLHTKVMYSFNTPIDGMSEDEYRIVRGTVVTVIGKSFAKINELKQEGQMSL